MTFTDYSDATPDVSIAYDALGRVISSSTLITDHSALITSSTFNYNSSNLAIDTETITYNLPGLATFTRVIDRSQDNLGRDSGWQLKDATTIENEVAYSYGSTDGRVASISGGGLHPPSQFDYTYTANSNLIATVTSPAHTVSNVYELDRNVLASKVNKKLDNTTISSYSYSVNNLGQRTQVTNSGTAFDSVRDITWGYDSKGQVTKADSTIAGLDRAYQYDMIGNRLKSADSLTLPTTNNYTPNALNQYSAIGSINPSYDEDGNATAYPLPANLTANSTLVWDGENRLISATVNGVTTTYRYDAQSRRIAIWRAGLQPASSPPDTTFVYDGWNPIAEYSTTYTLTKTYTWGIDLSGSMQGAGGVGGLLMVTVESAGSADRYFPTFDGNGNVSEYLDETGTVVAHYEYDPFGKTTVATGPKANDFAHRFSTKPLDATTGLYYYGYRFYDPNTGRWPSRDPIAERGGVNLYGFVWNDPIEWFDDLGHVPRSQREEQRIQRNQANQEGRRNNRNTETTAGIIDRFNNPNTRRGRGTRGAYDALGEAQDWISDIQGFRTISALQKKCKEMAKDRKKSEGWNGCVGCCLYTFLAPRVPSGRIIRNDITYLDITVYEGRCNLGMRAKFKNALGQKFYQEYIIGSGETLKPTMGQSAVVNVK